MSEGLPPHVGSGEGYDINGNKVETNLPAEVVIQQTPEVAADPYKSLMVDGQVYDMPI